MPEVLYDVEIPKTNYEVIYDDDPIEEEEVITVEVKKRWWCPCW